MTLTEACAWMFLHGFRITGWCVEDGIEKVCLFGPVDELTGDVRSKYMDVKPELLKIVKRRFKQLAPDDGDDEERVILV